MDNDVLKRFAAAGILAEIARLNALLEKLSSSTRASASGQQGRKPRRHMSAAARKRMSEMMKARWAARRAKRR